MLTRREREVLIELCRPSLQPIAFNEPATTREIAAALFVTEAAIKQHLLRLYDKLEIYDDGDNRRRRLANVALERGLVTNQDLGGAHDVSATTPAAVVGGTPAVRAGREAQRRRAWTDAFEILAAADDRGELTTADDHAALGEAALWAGFPERSQQARQRAYQILVVAGDERGAGVAALGLVVNFAVRLKLSVAAGWLGKAHAHLEPLPVGREHALLAATRGLAEVMTGELDRGAVSTRLAIELGRAHSDRDAIALGQVFHADVLVQRLELREARALYDEAMASATAGELGPLATGLTYCRTICSCLDLFDYRRAREWTDEVARCHETIDEGGFRGDCRAHRATLFALRGDRVRAEAEAVTACGETETFDLAHTGIASYELGLLRLHAGDLEAAHESFERAAQLGLVPEPGRSILLALRGKPEAARAALASALVNAPPLRRARLRPTEIEVLIALGQFDEARGALDDLEATANAVGSPALLTMAKHARGCILLADGDAETAVAELRASHHKFRELEMPYFAARARRDLGRALTIAGHAEDAAIELAAAATAFRTLGAADLTWG